MAQWTKTQKLSNPSDDRAQWTKNLMVANPTDYCFHVLREWARERGQCKRLLIDPKEFHAFIISEGEDDESIRYKIEGKRYTGLFLEEAQATVNMRRALARGKKSRTMIIFEDITIEEIQEVYAEMDRLAAKQEALDQASKIWENKILTETIEKHNMGPRCVPPTRPGEPPVRSKPPARPPTPLCHFPVMPQRPQPTSCGDCHPHVHAGMQQYPQKIPIPDHHSRICQDSAQAFNAGFGTPSSVAAYC